MTEARDLLTETVKTAESRRDSDEPGRLTELRQRALSTVRGRGFPTQKDEAWRFTNVRPLVKEPFSTSAKAPVDRDALESAIAPVGSLLWIENGMPDPSGVTMPRGVQLLRSSEALRREPQRIEPYLGQLARPDTAFVAQNTALFDEAVVLIVEPGVQVEQPIHLAFASSTDGTPAASYPRVLVVVGRSSSLRLVESHVHQGGQRHLENAVTEIVLDEGAELEHVRTHRGDATMYSIAATSVRQSRDSRYRSRTFTFGGALTRIDLHAVLDGTGAECVLDGLYLAGSDEHVDHHTLVEHPTSHASSRQRYKGILDGSGSGVFDGIVIVQRGSEKTQAHQENRNLLLSPRAQVHTKPHLEIDADDVQCSHGATIGRLDTEQLFYLRSRGIDEPAARAALTYAFARELIDDVPAPGLHDFLSRLVLGRLPQGDLVRQLS